MILQLKITLKESKPPIWRRIEVRDSMTFNELHSTIQIAFDWQNSHLYGFDVRKSNGIKIDGFYSIGPTDTEDYGFIENTYDEKEVQLKDIFKKEKDKVIYTYDYGVIGSMKLFLKKFYLNKQVYFIQDEQKPCVLHLKRIADLNIWKQAL